MKTYTETTELPIFLGAANKLTLLIAAKITSGSLTVQYKAGNDWIDVETFTEDFAREVNCSGMLVKFVVTGTVTYTIG